MCSLGETQEKYNWSRVKKTLFPPSQKSKLAWIYALVGKYEHNFIEGSPRNQ